MILHGLVWGTNSPQKSLTSYSPPSQNAGCVLADAYENGVGNQCSLPKHSSIMCEYLLQRCDDTTENSGVANYRDHFCPASENGSCITPGGVSMVIRNQSSPPVTNVTRVAKLSYYFSTPPAPNIHHWSQDASTQEHEVILWYLYGTLFGIHLPHGVKG